VQATADGGYILAGTTWANWYSGKAWLIKTDPAGREVWNQAFGDSRNPAGAVMGHEATCATQTPEGGYVLSGYSWAFSTAGFTYNPYGWLIKTDEAGNLIGTRTFDASYSPGVPACSVVSSVLATADGGYVLSGQTISSGAGSGDAWLAKTDSNGYVE
jgi:hypothetical protein